MAPSRSSQSSALGDLWIRRSGVRGAPGAQTKSPAVVAEDLTCPALVEKPKQGDLWEPFARVTPDLAITVRSVSAGHVAVVGVSSRIRPAQYPPPCTRRGSGEKVSGEVGGLDCARLVEQVAGVVEESEVSTV